MHNNTYTSLMYKNSILPKIQTYKGLKQGDNLSPPCFNIYINDLPAEIEKGKTDAVNINNHYLNSLMWADDIILLSKTREGLQNCLNNLYAYCQKWKLEVNLKKTKSMVFREKGTIITKALFHLNTEPILETKEYTYLGISINTSGNLKNGCTRLIDKARRAWYSILRILWKSKKRNIETYTKLFDHVIKPIALYSCEVWGTVENLPNRIDHLNTSVSELFQTRCCKNILGVSKKTTNIAILAELGRYPLYIDIHKKMIKYFIRMKSLNPERLLYKAYMEQKNEQTINHTNWLTSIKYILDHTGFSFVFTNNALKNPIKTNKLTDEIQNRSKEIFEQQLLYHIQEKGEKVEGKLVFYSKVKVKLKQELYLQLQNQKNRNAIRDLRISTHKLNIETGRYKGINRDERLCEQCELNTAETEEHFLTECPNYINERSSFLQYIKENTNISAKKRHKCNKETYGYRGFKYLK